VAQESTDLIKSVLMMKICAKIAAQEDF
jgi:hypothetical protein